MVRVLASTCLYLIGNALGILVAAAVLPNFSVTFISLLWVVVVFTVIVVVATPLLARLSLRYFPQLTGGISLVAILIGLIVAKLFTKDLTITGIETWIAAPVIIWIVSLIAGMVLPMILFKEVLKQKTNDP